MAPESTYFRFFAGFRLKIEHKSEVNCIATVENQATTDAPVEFVLCPVCRPEVSGLKGVVDCLFEFSLDGLTVRIGTLCKSLVHELPARSRTCGQRQPAVVLGRAGRSY